MILVFPGDTEVFARFVRPVKRLIREDFPTLERPMKAISGKFAGGHSEVFALLFMNSADFMFIPMILLFVEKHRSVQQP